MKRSSKRIKLETQDEPCEVEYLEEEVEDEEEEALEEIPEEENQNFDDVETAIPHVLKRLSGIEDLLKIVEKRIKKRIDREDPPVEEEATITLAFPVGTIEEISQFETEDLDSTVLSFIRNLYLNENKNVSIVFQCLVKDKLVLQLGSWENMSNYRLFRDILYDALKENFTEFDDFVLEMRKQIVKAINRAKAKSND
ncbi:uncharacterized protein LOC134827686 isoform X1 [Culicoides brevitarsis]|uniref:uncharacterized protein LOC134827686 isoform X1 n=1 Tax=Culicoides brevitarsis TaxID=469753 RepID=UPI00307B1807